MSPTDQIRLNSAAGHLQLGDALDAWHELEMIAPQARAQTEVLSVRLAVCRALKMWEVAEEIARTLIKREPENIMHVVALAEFVGKRQGPAAEDRISRKVKAFVKQTLERAKPTAL
jgi:hypothetical protein